MHIKPLPPPKMPVLHINSQDKPHKINGISFWAFIFSMFMYISIFYIFNLSPSCLFSTTKFWFFISNTLIIIIAADFGAFSSSIKDDFYDEYVKKSRARNVPSFELQYSKIEEKKYPKPVAVDQFQQEEIIKEVVVVHKSDESAKNKMEIVVKSGLEKKPNDNFQENILEVASKVDHDHTEKTRQDCQEKEKELRRVRSLSDRAVEMKDNEKKIVLHRSNTENHHDYNNNYEEENEFSSMSNEELNKRVEDFIRRFNRQIRLQAVDRRFQEV